MAQRTCSRECHGSWIEAGGDAFNVRQVKSKLSFLTAGLLLGIGIGLALPYVESSLSPMALDKPQSSLPPLEKSYERLFAAEEVIEADIAPGQTIAADHDEHALCSEFPMDSLQPMIGIDAGAQREDICGPRH